MNEKYHSVLVPLEDVYNLGGRHVFKGLSRKKEGLKNLIVLPSEIIEGIYPEKNKGNLNTGGGADVLNLLKESKSKIIENKNGAITYSINEGMDVTYLSGNNGEGFKLDEKLKEEINKKWKTKPKIITNNSRRHLECHFMGIEVEEPNFLMVNSDIVNEGVISGNDELYAKLYENKGKLFLEEAEKILNRELFTNQFIKFFREKGHEYAKVAGDIKKNAEGTRIREIDNLSVKLLAREEYNQKYKLGNVFLNGILGIAPRNMEQYLAVQYGVLNPEVELSFICGSQGSGKTLLGYTGAVELILHYDKELREQRGGRNNKESFFKKIVLLKPNDMMGGKKRSEGYLPGNLWEKVREHLKPYIDAHRESDLDSIPFKEMILHPRRINEYGGQRNEDIKINKRAYLPSKNEAIELVLSGYLRGRSFRDSLILVDEAQNFTPYEMKTIISRLGLGSKCIIMGDPYQFDNPDCSRDINGLTSAINHFLPKHQTSLVHLTKNYRLESSEQTLDWNVYNL